MALAYETVYRNKDLVQKEEASEMETQKMVWSSQAWNGKT